MKELRAQNIKELYALKTEKSGELYKLMQEIIKGKEKNVSKIRVLKKEIARIATVLSEKAKEVQG